MKNAPLDIRDKSIEFVAVRNTALAMIHANDEFAMFPDDEFMESNVTEICDHWFSGTLFTVVQFT